MELIAKIVDSFQSFTIFTIISILDVRLGFGYASSLFICFSWILFVRKLLRSHWAVELLCFYSTGFYISFSLKKIWMNSFLLRLFLESDSSFKMCTCFEDLPRLKILRNPINVKPPISIYLEPLAHSFSKVSASESLHIY